ncbi:Pyridoxal phosphate-dependent transferases superfamily protein [Hibiscus syriacus]|uniref:Pyridoxal phosphate-dependent transferases superfamily protein n=1 Tax=Hibiscus syriacus TaxID=106335 RepID=A0A6A2ZRX0_HIBSY|nr:Pyridoxal phosphate-dependent transferases superfamily protein [Hibiscus syriacus]
MPSEVPQFSCTEASGTSPKLDGAARKMKFPEKKLLPMLVFILSGLSILRLLKFAITTTSHSSSQAATLSSSIQQECSLPSECSKAQSNAPGLESGPRGTTTNAPPSHPEGIHVSFKSHYQQSTL